MYPRIILICCCLLGATSTLAASPQALERLIAEGRFAAAASDGQALLEQQPKQLRVRFLTAYALQMSEQPEAAIALYEALIADYPDLPEPRNNLAMIHLAAGDYDRASRLLVDAINTHPSYATAYDNLSRIYKAIASEAYRRAVSESKEPAKYTHDIELVAIDRLAAVEQGLIEDSADTETSAINTANLETLLLERVQNWAAAWSAKDFAAYVGFYSPQYRAKFESHDDWKAYRRERILRPGEIRVEVDDIKIRWVSENLAIIDFRQAFDSPTYSDRVVKRLAFSRFGTTWKITDERVLSVL